MLKEYSAPKFSAINAAVHITQRKIITMRKKLLITGGAGYIGSHISNLMMQQGYVVIILDNLHNQMDNAHISGNANMVSNINNVCMMGNGSNRDSKLPYAQHIIEQNSIKQIKNGLCDYTQPILIAGDYGNKQLLDTVFDTYPIDAVIHCASSGSACEATINRQLDIESNTTPNSLLMGKNRDGADPLALYDNNVSKTITLLQSMIAHDIKKIIFSSSAAVYGMPQQVPITENHPTQPINPYGQTKLMIERILKDTQIMHNLQFISLRYFTVAGISHNYPYAYSHSYSHALSLEYPNSHPYNCLQKITKKGRPLSHDRPLVILPNNIISTIVHTLRTKQPLYIQSTAHATPDGSTICDFVHVQDIANAHLKALHHLDADLPSDIFNLGSGTGSSEKQVISMVEYITNKKIVAIEKCNPKEKVPILIADSTRAQDILRWTPDHSHLATIIKSYLLV